jgi:hypothetical protein
MPFILRTKLSVNNFLREDAKAFWRDFAKLKIAHLSWGQQHQRSPWVQLLHDKRLLLDRIGRVKFESISINVQRM